jgi:sialate O-acetylesterase
MSRVWRAWLSAAALLAVMAPSQAALQLPKVFGTHMVLQQGLAVPVWGFAAPGQDVTVTFGAQTVKAKAGADGKFLAKLEPLTASKTGAQLKVSAGDDTVTCDDVLVGEVWLCGGQSNMEFTTGGVTNFGAERQDAANYPMIRHIKVNNDHSARPQTQVNGDWQVCTPGSVGGFTAVGYFFARELVKALDVPVGLLNGNWGGTSIESWTPPAGWRTVPELKDWANRVDSWQTDTEAGAKAWADYLDKLKTWLPAAEAALAAHQALPPSPVEPGPGSDIQQPTRLFNGRINPLAPFAMKGALWYQGENNGGEGISYYHKMRALINGWRAVWGEGDFPFYFVQLANFQTSNANNWAAGDGWARIREAQRAALAIPHTGMACIIDIGDAGNIHPTDKQDVGKRLALWALAKDYGKDVVWSGPLFKSMTVEGAKARIAFDCVGGGLMVGEKHGIQPTAAVPDGKLTWFAIRDKDGRWHNAEAVIDGATVVVSSPEVTEPTAVRYAYAMNPAGCNLYNKEGLPAAPFATDFK